MPNIAVVGAQWGDEGKGKIVDLLSEHFQVVARFQGGPNAGHTVTIGGQRYALHHIPSGVFRPDVNAVIGNGTVLDLAEALKEIDGLESAGIRLAGRLHVSDRAHVILPWLKRLDALAESAADPATRIGTTLRGIGPTYEAKAARWGLRLGHLADLASLEVRLQRILDGPCGVRLRGGGDEPGDARRLAAEAHALFQRIEPYMGDTVTLLNDWIDEGKDVLFEGAQGTMLDIDHGTYPFVTSSSTIAGGLCAGLGVGPTVVTGVLGVYKAYTTRVGAGPMPTELEDGPNGLGEKLRKRGREYGTTTGRPRRCGWFDGVAGRHAYRLNRFSGACVTLLDVLDTFDEIQVCVGYRLDGKGIRSLPADCETAERVEPRYESIEGWNCDTTGARQWSDLPEAAVRFLDRLSEIIGTEIVMVGVGPDRSQSIFKPGSWLSEKLGT